MKIEYSSFYTHLVFSTLGRPAQEFDNKVGTGYCPLSTKVIAYSAIRFNQVHTIGNLTY